MKKYVSLIVCAIITFVALIVPIGSGARYNGKGSGSNNSVKSLSELSTSLKGNSATYTLSYSEGIDINRHSLTILEENYQDETKTAYVNVFVDQNLNKRVSNLHSPSGEDSPSFGKLANNYDYMYFISMDMDLGIVKINYQNDDYGKAEIPKENWTSYGYSSASDLGLDTKEATSAITVYSDSARKTEAFTIKKDQVFIVTAEEDGVKTIQYCEGYDSEFKKGYISSNSYQDVYVSVYFDVKEETDIKNETDEHKQNFFLAYNNKRLNQGLTNVYHGDCYRYYSSGREKGSAVEYSEIRVLIDGTWTTKYCKANSIKNRVEAMPYNKIFTSGYDKGEIKVFQTKDLIYAQVEAETSLAHGSESLTRTTINAEFILTANKSLVKINSFFYADESGPNANTEGMKYLTGSEDGKSLSQGSVKVNQWVDAKDAKIYFKNADRPEGEFYNPLNFFIDKYFNADGTLKYTDFITAIIDSNSLEQNGKQAVVKSSIKQELVREGLYSIVFGDKYNSFQPINTPEEIRESASIEIDFRNKKAPVIKSKYMYFMPEISVFEHSTSLFTTASDRTLVVENVGNTVVPKVVLDEVKGLLG